MRPVAVLALNAVLWLSGSAAHAHAQSRALDDVRRALDHVDVVACVDAAGVTPAEVRVAVVVYPDGAYELALGPIATLTVVTSAHQDAIRRCARTAFDAALAAPVAHPPRVASVVTRTVTIPSGAEREIDARLRGGLETIERCVFSGAHAPHARMVARVRIEPAQDGTAQVRSLGAGGAALARCVAPVLGMLPTDTPPVDRELTLSPPPPLPPPPPPVHVARPDGREGAICSWGQRRPDWMSLPEPMGCRAGLQCCSAGGAAGSDAVCMRVQTCPMYP